MLERMIKAFLSLFSADRAVTYSVQDGNIIQESKRARRSMFPNDSIDWWRYDAMQQLTIVQLKNGEKLLIKDASKRLARCLKGATGRSG